MLFTSLGINMIIVSIILSLLVVILADEKQDSAFGHAHR